MAPTLEDLLNLQPDQITPQHVHMLGLAPDPIVPPPAPAAPPIAKMTPPAAAAPEPALPKMTAPNTSGVTLHYHEAPEAKPKEPKEPKAEEKPVEDTSGSFRAGSTATPVRNWEPIAPKPEVPSKAAPAAAPVAPNVGVPSFQPPAASSASPLPPLTLPNVPEALRQTSPTATPNALTPPGPPPPIDQSLLNAPKRSLEGFGSREAEPRNLSLDTTAGGPQVLDRPGTSGSQADFLARHADEAAHPWGTPENHPGGLGKLAHGAARIGNILGDIFAPGAMQRIPGTDLNKQLQEKQAYERLAGAQTRETQAANEKSEEGLRKAQIDNLESEAAARGVGTENLLTDKNGNVVGWKDKDATGKIVLHSLEDPNTPPAIRQIAAATSAKMGLTPDEQAVAAKMKETNPDTGKPYTAYEADVALAQGKAAVKPPPKDNATVEDERYEKIRTDMGLHRPVTAEDAAWAQAYERRKTLAPFAGAAAQAPHQATERSDTSYNRNVARLDKLSQPIEATQARMGRLNDALAQHTPTADALMGPELMTIMAGGQGSGLRMTDTEINRIVGGRSHWENLQAAINQWSLDPSKANSITEEQRKEIRALATAVQSKLSAKQKILSDADQGLLGTDDPKAHRQIVADAHQKLDAIDSGGAPGGGGGSLANPELGATRVHKTTGAIDRWDGTAWQPVKATARQ